MPTSRLQELAGKKLRFRFGEWEILENHRPEWMTTLKGERLELDFLIRKLKIAIEIQGNQHCEFVPFFHSTEKEFANQKERDKSKETLCSENSVELIMVHNEAELNDTIEYIENIVMMRGSNKYTPPKPSGYNRIIRHIETALNKTIICINDNDPAAFIYNYHRVKSCLSTPIINAMIHYDPEIARQLKQGENLIRKRIREIRHKAKEARSCLSP